MFVCFGGIYSSVFIWNFNVGRVFMSPFFYMFIYPFIAVLCKFLRGCVTLCVASRVACGLIRLFGPDLCLHVVVVVLYVACVYNWRYVVCLLSRLGICRIYVPPYYWLYYA
jgi:hypothetical protein